jgi:hypothetical protein
MVREGGRKLLWSRNRIGHNDQVGRKSPQQEGAPKGQDGAPGDCGSFVEVSPALLSFVVLWGRFATDIPRAKLLKIKYIQSPKASQLTHNPKVAGSNPAPATNFPALDQ